MITVKAVRLAVLAFVLLLAVGLAHAGQTSEAPSAFNSRLLSVFQYRNTGPFRLGARVSDIAVPNGPDHLYTWYVAFWTGGLWKTTNNGTTFEPVFDKEDNLAIGAVTVAPSNPNVVWVGTGDAFTSRSSFAGDGVYKSTDGGKTWKNMGLRDSQHIARIRIDPTNPNNVYVAAMGHLYSENTERGVFHSTDGGRTWQKSLYIDDKVGVIDLVMDPKNPKVLYAATYDKKRLPWQMINGGPGSGIYKTEDGGKTWRRLGGGLPGGRIGRIGLDIYPKDPKIVYAVIENANTAKKPLGPNDRVATRGEIYRTEDGGEHWVKMTPDNYNAMPKGPYYFSQIRVDPNDDKRIIVTGEPFRVSEDGGKTWKRRIFKGMFGDFRTLWIDPQDSRRIMIGSDGGFAISYDGGKTSDHYGHIPVGEIYNISYDMEEPYNIYAGLQDHEQWKGPSTGPLRFGTSPYDWVALGDGDGEYTQADPNDPRWVYTTREYGGHTRVDMKLGYEINIIPVPPPGDPDYRFLWTPPIVVSPHNSKVIYAGAQRLLKSTDRGDHWTPISPDLSTHPPDKIMRESEAGLPGGIPWFAISTISESPITEGLIWVGTSDGKLQMTRDGGATWTDFTESLTKLGARADGYVTRVQASAHIAGRAYVAKSGYKYDDFKPYLYVTDNYGKSWKSISAGLPNKPIDVVFEDQANPNLLFVGDDTGVFVTMDRGRHWVKMNNNMPNIPVFDIQVQPRDHDLILGTYGRDFWITNISALEQLTPAVLAEDVHLFDTDPAVQRVTWCFGANDYYFGQRVILTPNKPSVMSIRYYLKDKPADAVVTITNAEGQQVASLKSKGKPGINTVEWDMRKPVKTHRVSARRTGTDDGDACTAHGPGPGPPPVVDRLMPLGTYTVTLEVAGRRLTQKATIRATQGWSMGLTPQFLRRLPE